MIAVVCPYSPAWAEQFDREAAVLTAHLAPWLTGGVHHIGSTAVPGLPAKPILDLLAGVGDLEQARAAVPVLEQLGYRHAEHRPHEALWFYRQPGDDYSQRTHQLHLTAVGSALWRERLIFRDALRHDADLRAEYAEIKHRLAGQDLSTYTDGKRSFVARVLRTGGIDLEEAP